MATYEERLTIGRKPDEALGACARALALGGFKDIETSEVANMVTAKKRSATQWTANSVVVIVEPSGDGTELTVQGSAKAQSLISAASSPAKKIVGQAVAALRSA